MSEYIPTTREVSVTYVIGECLTSKGLTTDEALAGFKLWFAEKLDEQDKVTTGRIIALLEENACPDTCACSQFAWTEEAIQLIKGEEQ